MPDTPLSCARRESGVSGIEVDNDISGRYESFVHPDTPLSCARREWPLIKSIGNGRPASEVILVEVVRRNLRQQGISRQPCSQRDRSAGFQKGSSLHSRPSVRGGKRSLALR